MDSRRLAPRFVGLVSLCALIAAGASGQSLAPTGQSAWVFFGPDHRLQYAPDANGNTIMDFSSAGYGGGGIALPDVPTRMSVGPSGGDDTAALQAALDAVAAMPVDAAGFRGALLLAPGSYTVSRSLRISASGVVLRGSGSGADGSVITMAGNPFTLLQVNGTGSPASVGKSTPITDAYVPSGARSFNVADGSSFSVGDTVLVRRPVTAAWIHLMDMDTLTRNGAPQTWIPAGQTISTDRVIAAIDGNRVTLDVPVTDSFDAQFLSPPGSSLVKYAYPGRLTQVGVEGFSVIAPAIDDNQYHALSMNAVMDAWLRDLVIQDTQDSVSLGSNTKRVTLENVHVQHTTRQSDSAAPVDFAFSGTQILLDKSSVTGNGNTWPAVTHTKTTGPVVLLNFFADDRGFGPHQRWATGLLCDDCNFPNSHTGDKAGIGYSNRGNFGSGHGWDAGFAVAWNVTSTFFLVQQPPGVDNWCIGCVGGILTEARPGSSTLLPNGIYDSFGVPVSPSSLYLQQLLERRGPQSLIDIGHLDYLKSIDQTAPVTTASLAPSANAAGWNNSDVTVGLSASDGAPGEGVGTRDISYSTSGAQSTPSTTVPGSSASFVLGAEGTTMVSFAATDFAQNAETPHAAVVMIDKTPPTLTGATSPAPNANGWNNTDVTVAFGATDAVSGVAAVSDPVVVKTEGKAQIVTGTAADRAGNTASLPIAVSLDRTPPESTQQLDPAVLDVVLFGRDSLSGTDPGAVTPAVVSLLSGTDPNVPTIELRTYTVLDLAGNRLVVRTQATKMGSRETVRVVSLQYASGAVVAPPPNTMSFDRATRADGSLRTLDQRFEVGTGAGRQAVSAHFDADATQTVILDGHGQIVRSGLVPLQMTTSGGALGVTF
jgi:hypothetical protein